MARLSELRVIEVRANDATDDGLQRLCALKKLVAVMLGPTKIMAAGMNTFKANLPAATLDCQIAADNDE